MPQSHTRHDLFQVLVTDGLITPDLADSVRARAQDEWVPLGRILRDSCKLTMSQIMELIEAQAREPDTRLGELAVRKQLCTPAQIEAALAQQRARSRHALEILLDEQLVDPERLCRALIRYVAQAEAG